MVRQGAWEALVKRTVAGSRIGRPSFCGVWVLLGAAISGCVQPTRDEAGIARVGGDLLGAHGELRVVDEVPGDVILAGGEIQFEGVAGGDLLSAGGRQVVTGRVEGSVRAAGGHIVLESEVGRNATVAGGQVEVRDPGAISGNAYLAGGSVRVDGRVGQTLQVRAGEAVLNGKVGGDVYVAADGLRIGPEAEIDGDLTYRVASENVTIDPGARIAGRTIVLEPRPRSAFPRLFRAVWLVGFLVSGAVLVLLFPGTIESAAAALGRRPGASIGLGIVWLIAVPLAACILAITLIGLPLALVIGALYAASLYFARVVPALLLGRLVLRDRAGAGRGAALLSFLAGGVLLVLAELIPFVGTPILIVATIIGLGAFTLALRAARAHRPV